MSEQWFAARFTNLPESGKLESDCQLTSDELEWANTVWFYGMSLKAIGQHLGCSFRWLEPIYNRVKIHPEKIND